MQEKKSSGNTLCYYGVIHQKEINQDIHELFDIVYSNEIPEEIQQYFTYTYLFCLYKDTNNLTKLRPLGVPLSLRHFIASHVARKGALRFARKLLPYNYVVRVKWGMEFIIKTV